MVIAKILTYIDGLKAVLFQGLSIREAAKSQKYSHSTLARLVKQFNQFLELEKGVTQTSSSDQSLTYEATPQDVDDFIDYLKKRDHRKKISQELEERIKRHCEEYPELTIRQRCVYFGIKKSRMQELMVLCRRSDEIMQGRQNNS